MIRTAIIRNLSDDGDVANALCRECGRIVGLVTWKVTEDAGRIRVTRAFCQPERSMVARPNAVEGLPTFGLPAKRRYDGLERSHGEPKQGRNIGPGGSPEASWHASAAAGRLACPIVVYCTGCNARNKVDAGSAVQ